MANIGFSYVSVIRVEAWQRLDWLLLPRWRPLRPANPDQGLQNRGQRPVDLALRVARVHAHPADVLLQVEVTQDVHLALFDAK